MVERVYHPGSEFTLPDDLIDGVLTTMENERYVSQVVAEAVPAH